MVDVDDVAFKSLTGELTKEWPTIVLKDTVSQLKRGKSYINNIDVIFK